MPSLVAALHLDRDRLHARAWIALFLVSVISMLPGFGTLPPIDRDESRYAQASRQMMETGDYIDIQFQDQNRYVKPVGSYWMQVITALPLGGENAPIWAHRLPSLFASLFTVGLIAWFGARLTGAGGAGVGFAAGVILALALSVSVDARMAKTDAALMAATASAMTALYFILVRAKDERLAFRGAPLIFWAALGLGLLIKGPIILFVAVPAMIVWGLWNRDWSFLKRLHLLPGIAVMLAVFLPWFVAIMIKTGGEFWQDSIGHALMGKVAQSDDSHGAPPGYHTLGLALTFWPGVLLLGLAGAAAWVRRKEPSMRFLLVWLLPFWLIYELVATKLPHYTLPVFPALALIAAIGLAGAGERLSARPGRIAHWVLTAVFVLVCLVIAWLPFYLAGEMETSAPGAAWGVVLFALLAAGSGLWLAAKPGLDRLGPLALSALGVYIFVFGATLPAMDRFWLSHSLKREVAMLEGCESVRLATIDYREPSLVFNFGTDTLLGDQASVIAMLQAEPCGLAAIGQRELAGFLAATEEAGVPVKLLGEVRGYNYTKGRDITLTILSSDDSAFTVPGSAEE